MTAQMTFLYRHWFKTRNVQKFGTEGEGESGVKNK